MDKLCAKCEYSLLCLAGMSVTVYECRECGFTLEAFGRNKNFRYIPLSHEYSNCKSANFTSINRRCDTCTERMAEAMTRSARGSPV